MHDDYPPPLIGMLVPVLILIGVFALGALAGYLASGCP